MTRKKGTGPISIGHKIDRELWERFQALADGMRPRVSYKSLLEEAITEYLERHGPSDPKKKEGGR